MKAQLGETVTLAVNIKGGDKTGVTFEIKLGDQLLASVPGTVKDGTATGSWKVDLKGNAPPREVVFTATSGGKAVSSNKLEVVAAVPVVGPLGPSGKNAGIITLAHGVLQIDVGSQVEMETTLSTGEPADVEVFVDDVPPGDANQPGKPIGEAVFRKSGVSGAKLEKLIVPWEVKPVGTPLVRLRADIKVGGEVVEQRRSNLILLADWVDVTLKDPAAVASYRLGMEGRERHVFLSGQPVPEVPDPPPAPAPPPVTAERQAAWCHAALRVELDGAVPEQRVVPSDEQGFARVRFAHGTKAQKIALRAEQTCYEGAWRDADAASAAESVHKVVQPRTKVDFTITARRRFSLWLTPDKVFGWPQQVGTTWPDAQRWTYMREHIDDVVLLNVFTPLPAHDVSKTTVRYGASYGSTGSVADLKRIVDACHAQSVQILLGNGGVINNIDDLPWLKFLNHEEPLDDAKIHEHATAIVAKVFDEDKIGADGLDFDLEHLTISSVWPMKLRKRVRVFYAALALELKKRGKLLGIASASFVSHADVAPNTPITGSGTAQPFTLAIECQNIVLRPMCYDNAFLDNQLLDFQRQVVKFVLTDAASGAGVHPAQFQIGVKTEKGTNNSEEPPLVISDSDSPEEKQRKRDINNKRIKGWLRHMPTDLITIIKDTLNPARVGVILFGPAWQHIPAIDAALNPLPGEKKQPKVPGTPLQAPQPKP